MTTVLIFAGKKFYPEGGTRDLRVTQFNADAPSDVDIGSLFMASAEKEEWLDDDYWANALLVEADGSVRELRWLVYLRKTEDADLPEEAKYATVIDRLGPFRVLVVPIAERLDAQGLCVWVGPRDYPEVTFY